MLYYIHKIIWQRLLDSQQIPSVSKCSFQRKIYVIKIWKYLRLPWIDNLNGTEIDSYAAKIMPHNLCNIGLKNIRHYPTQTNPKISSNNNFELVYERIYWKHS